jgi:hypothetical protein
VRPAPGKADTHWKPPFDRLDAVQLVLKAEEGRLLDLRPLRLGRTARSSFTFYSGAALTTVPDLVSVSSSGVRV